MKTFLEITATDLSERFKGDFSQVTIVFPNKRASLFFNGHLAALSAKPLWSPRYLSISELFHSLSSLQVADPILLVCELHECYQQVTQLDESLDDFYFWGETLLADFDDVDKNMVNAMQLFQGLSELNHLTDNNDFLDEEQRNVLQEFFKNFKIDQQTQLKERFQIIWDSLGKIYNAFREKLSERRLAYEGMLYRNVAESLDSEETTAKLTDNQTYVFVGFNVLNQVERHLFRHLAKRRQALFYWDYDEFYTTRPHHEAGEFINRNLKEFPNALDSQWFDNLRREKEITFMETSAENAQARYLPQWIDQNITPMEHETAVVLCNENLLPAVIHCLPDTVKNLNITMGYPLTSTQAYAKSVSNADEAPLTPPTDSALETEAAYRIHLIDNRLQTLIDDGTLHLEPATLRRLKQRIMQATSIPFHGEPAIGLQVMGVLETRNLDFRHLIMLSVNEGMLPKLGSNSSIIPYSLRKAFGMTTIDHQMSVYAYYFYRLLQRAEKITLLYSAGESGMTSNEMSRFMLQLSIELPYNIHRVTLTTAQSSLQPTDFIIRKEQWIIDRLHRTFDLRKNPNACFSPTALNCYMNCSLQFYFKYIAKLQEPQKQANDFATFGTLFHAAAQFIYDSEVPDKKDIVDACIERAFTQNDIPRHILIEAVLKKYLQLLLDMDNASKPFTYVASEKTMYMTISLTDIDVETRVGGTIDRIDKKDNQTRIVDYKTGSNHHQLANVQSLFDTSNKQRHTHAFQALLYASVVCETETGSVVPALLYLRKLPKSYNESFLQIGNDTINDFHTLKNDFDGLLTNLLHEIFDVQVPFQATSNKDQCKNCPYCGLCGKASS